MQTPRVRKYFAGASIMRATARSTSLAPLATAIFGDIFGAVAGSVYGCVNKLPLL